MPVDVQGLGVDLLAFSLHKMLGPTGMGALYGRGEVLRALDGALIGGNTVTDSTYTSREPAQVPDRLEAGLQDYAGAVGSRAAVDYLSRLGMGWVEGHAALLNERLSRALEPIEGVRVLGPSEARRRGSICSFTVEGADCRDLSVILDEYANVCVRAGRHCAHSWYNAAGVASALRASFYVYNTEAEVDAFAEALRTVLGRVRR
jgi:cysteine desulfurase/selenocysteine lyase